MILGAGLVASSCDDDDDDNKTVTKNISTVTFEGSYWNALIDDPQYGGPLLYGDNCNEYNWTDEETSLHGGMTMAYGGYYGFSEGGTAISNYIDADLVNHATYEYQLAVPVSNGSSNFVVVYCEAAGDVSTAVTFADGKARQIKSMDICPTTYELGVELYGDSYCKALTEEGDYLTLTITANNGKTFDIDLARDGKILQDWTTIDLTSLGEVTSLGFTMSGSDGSEWDGVFYLNSPVYFALDNVVISQ